MAGIQFACNDGDEVGDVLLVHFPVEHGAVRHLLDFHELAVADGRLALLNFDKAFAGRLLVRIVPSREPVPVVHHLALRVDDCGVAGKGTLARDHVDTGLRLALVEHVDLYRLALFGACGQVHSNHLLVCGEGRGSAVDQHLGNLQLCAVEGDAGWVGHHLHRVDGVAMKDPGVLIGLEVNVPRDVHKMKIVWTRLGEAKGREESAAKGYGQSPEGHGSSIVVKASSLSQLRATGPTDTISKLHARN